MSSDLFDREWNLMDEPLEGQVAVLLHHAASLAENEQFIKDYLEAMVVHESHDILLSFLQGGSGHDSSRRLP